MTDEKDSKAISQLRQEWDIYKKKHMVTQAQASEKLGWSTSFFGSLLRGTSSVGVENQIKIANLFGIDPLALNPESDVPRFHRLPVYATTSGKPPPADSKLFPVFDPDRVCIWADETIKMVSKGTYDKESGRTDLKEGTVIGLIPTGSTLLCSRVDYPAAVDPMFQLHDLPTWIVLEEGKSAKVYVSRKKPSSRVSRPMIANVKILKKEVFRLLGVVMF